MGSQRIAVVGVGAIGGAVAADLADLGRHDISLCSRTPFRQLVVEHPGGVSRVDGGVRTSPTEARMAEWVLLATKATQSADVEPWLHALCGPGTTVAILQNGVDHLERIGPLVHPSVTLLPVVVQIPAERMSVGRVKQPHPGMLIVPDDDRGRGFASLFRGGRTRVEPTGEFGTQAWWKLIANAALGGVCALAIRDNGVVEDPEVREFVLALMREAVQVGRAEGAKLPDDAPEKALDLMLRGAPGHWPSIAVDRREGRPMEWEVRNEVVCRYGRRHGIATPLNDAMTVLLKAADRRRPAAIVGIDPSTSTRA